MASSLTATKTINLFVSRTSSSEWPLEFDYKDFPFFVKHFPTLGKSLRWFTHGILRWPIAPYGFSGLISLKDCGLRDYKRPFLQHSRRGPWWKTRVKGSSHFRGLSQFLSPYPPSNSSSIPQRRSKPFNHHNCISRGGIHTFTFAVLTHRSR